MFIFNLNFKSLHLFVYEFDIISFLILNSITFDNFNIKILTFELNIFYIKIVFMNKTIFIKSIKKFIPDKIESICKNFLLPNIIIFPKNYIFISKNKEIYFKITFFKL